MTADRYGVVVVGASVAAEAFVSRLRELGDEREILVVDRDPRMPYERPPLSKLYLTESERPEIDVEWDERTPVTTARALAVDPEARTLTLGIAATGSTRTVAYDTLVVATGATPIRLPFEPEGVLHLRSVEDADLIRESISSGSRVGIIGAGAIGCELATSARALGAEVVLLDKADRPLERLLAGQLGSDVTAWLHDLGIVCRWQADISGISGRAGTWAVGLDGGAETLVFDVLISAVGVRPALDWLASSGLLSDGRLICDETGRVIGGADATADVYGIGDVVTRRLADGALLRTESWSSAAEQGRQLAERLAGNPEPETEPAYFWTDVAGRKIQVLGRISRDGAVTVEFENPARGSVLYRVVGADGEEGWVGVNAPQKIAMLRMGRPVVAG
ncbi:FAD-dependent oxidoreductase [Leucobacter weissii]|uniref:FAD-dependent oxidoreductase n=1 Tax=Leucobacter weissii TaxID=1983706 RepID=A0A939MK01_9MICO|nr:FAD-dependent oxidoreductase [Leucobacter weissii]